MLHGPVILAHARDAMTAAASVAVAIQMNDLDYLREAIAELESCTAAIGSLSLA